MKKKGKGIGMWGVLALAMAGVVPAGGNARGDSAVAWGNNGFGQLGNGSTIDSSVPVAVSGMNSGVTAIAAGGSHSLAIQNGAAYAWGNGFDGQLGNGSFGFSSTPVAVSGLTNGVTAIAVGESHSLAIQNGAAYAWGDNSRGQLGNGSFNDSNTPVAVSGMTSGVSAIAGGEYHSLAIQNGAAYAWGDNIFGQLGNRILFGPSRTPVAVSGLTSGVTAIAAGYEHSLAIKNGTVYAWGRNTWGDLGNGSFIFSATSPEAVSGLNGVTAIAAGYYHSLAIQNGAVYAWGDNTLGELGDGTTNASDLPEQVDPTDLKNIVAIAAGYGSSYALSADGSLWVSGDNYYGKLGLGTTTSYYDTPQHLLAPAGYVFTSIDADADGYHAVATLAAVPEPGTLGMLVVGGTLLMRRRRKKE